MAAIDSRYSITGFPFMVVTGDGVHERELFASEARTRSSKINISLR